MAGKSKARKPKTESGGASDTATYPLHPVCHDYADFTRDEADAMRASLRKIGLLAPIALWRDQIVDGRHRDLLCRELGIEPRYADLTDRCKTEKEMRAYVAALNEHRRARTMPLTVTEKRAKVDAAIKADPERSDRAIAEACGVSDPFVAKRRKELSKEGANVSTPPGKRRSRTGKAGEGQRKRQRQPEPQPEPEPEHHNNTQPPKHWTEYTPAEQRFWEKWVKVEEMARRPHNNEVESSAAARKSQEMLDSQGVTRADLPDRLKKYLDSLEPEPPITLTKAQQRAQAKRQKQAVDKLMSILKYLDRSISWHRGRETEVYTPDVVAWLRQEANQQNRDDVMNWLRGVMETLTSLKTAIETPDDESADPDQTDPPPPEPAPVEEAMPDLPEHLRRTATAK